MQIYYLYRDPLPFPTRWKRGYSVEVRIRLGRERDCMPHPLPPLLKLQEGEGGLSASSLLGYLESKEPLGF